MKREPRQLGAVFETPLRERLQLVRVEREPLERRAPAEGLCREGRRELVRVQRKAGEFLQFSQGSLWYRRDAVGVEVEAGEEAVVDG